ncbi:MAG TPA: DUF3306 domain-containing protein [Noviherbaspirillum sp.]|jgi:hypothetical protein|uniref:DUF3306 domain-containing protein n=1 Tax=Noviherbaspirillum sp. TaxID=1926288 RepID=UPI002F92D712
MEAESFFARWEKRNAEKRIDDQRSAEQREATQGPASSSGAAPPAPPTMDEVGQLSVDSDFTRFVARGVDEDVRRAAMKKLFADPQFNVMDGLDVYIEDYNTFTPIPAHVLSALNHAKALLDPLAHLQHPAMRLIDALGAPDDRKPPEQAQLPEQARKPDLQAAGADEGGEQAEQVKQAEQGQPSAQSKTEGQQDDANPI